MNLLRYSRFTPVVCLTGWLVFVAGCWGGPDRIVVHDTPGGTVALQAFAKRGATGRYPGPLRSIKASHPLLISPDQVKQLLEGIRIGILPSDRQPDATGIKPTPLFSPAEAAALAPAVANALKQADPDHYVTFQTGGTESTGGALYVAGPVIQLTLNHYRSPARQRDDGLAVYRLSFTPAAAQAAVAGSPDWMESDSHKPRLAVEYGKLETGTASVGAPAAAENHGSSTRAEPSAPSEMERMKAAMDKQALELESLKAELDSLRKQLGGQSAPQKTGPKSGTPPR